MHTPLIHDPVLTAGAAIYFIAAIFGLWFFNSSDRSFGEFSAGISQSQLYAYLVLIIPVVSGISYLMLSMGLGVLVLDDAPFFWLRSFELAVTSPLIILGAMVLTEDSSLTTYTIGADYMAITFGFLAAIASGTLALVFSVLTVISIMIGLWIMYVKVEERKKQRLAYSQRMFERLRTLIAPMLLLFGAAVLISPRGLGLLGPTATVRMYLGLDLILKLGFMAIVLHGLKTGPRLDIQFSVDE